MQQIHIQGSKQLEDLNIDISQSNIRIIVDYLHIHPFTPNEIFHAHAHPNIEFHYIAKGCGFVGVHDHSDMIDKKTIISKPASIHTPTLSDVQEYNLKAAYQKKIESRSKYFELNAGDVFINSPGQFHWQISDKKEPIIEYALRCFFDVTTEQDGKKSELFDEYELLSRIIKETSFDVVQDSHNVRFMFESIFEEANFKIPGYMTIIKNHLFDLIIAFSRNFCYKTTAYYPVPKINIVKVRKRMIEDYIHFNLSHNITLDELANHVNMSKRSLARFVRQEMDLPVHQYILSVKLDKALELISSTKEKLMDIAEWTGFSSGFHLSRVIKKHTAKTPSEIRQNKKL